MRSTYVFFASISGFITVAMGAFAAHVLKPEFSDYQMDIYRTAVQYQMWHTLLLVLLAGLPSHRLLNWVAGLLGAGMLLFCGSLYLLAILQIKWLGAVTPVGGVLLLAAWGLLAFLGWKQKLNHFKHVVLKRPHDKSDALPDKK